LTPITVSELNNQIKSILESTFINVLVSGEVSRVTYHSSGHLYFTLKDKDSAISCVMFRGNNQKLKFRVEEGLKVIINGTISVYTPRGSYQINCFTMEPEGSGALALAYEQLKKKLEKKGYFDKNIKKPMPKFPDSIAVITSKTGAALQDMLRVAKKRWPLAKIILIDTLVQGDSAASMIAKNIKVADSLGVDIIVISRGGGSLEDLWAFNEEIVACAIYEAKTPIVSAVGHEIDFLISDFVSDLRAPTPSAAIEMILPDINEILLYIDTLFDNYFATMQRILHKKAQEIAHLKFAYKQNSISSKISLFGKEIKSLKERFDMSFDIMLQRKKELLQTIEIGLKNSDPKKRVKFGFAQVLKDSKPISLDKLGIADRFKIIDAKVEIEAEVISKDSL